MGLACGQVNMLFLVQRKADIELGLALDSADKMALTREQTQLSQEYYSRLHEKKVSYYSNGQYHKINYEYLMGYGCRYNAITDPGKYPLKNENSMILTDYKGQVVLSDTYAKAITNVLGSDIMNREGAGKTFSLDNMAAIIANLVPTFTKEDFEAVLNDKEIAESTYTSTILKTKTLVETGKTVTNNTDSKTARIKAIVDFYQPIFAAAATNGWTTEYNNAMSTNDDYISDALNTGSFQLETVDIDGNYDPNSCLTYFVNNGSIYTKPDSDSREELQAWYEAEKAAIKEKEDAIDIDMDTLSTELEAVNTEIQSIQSFIDDNIQSVFDWGNG